MCTVSPSSDLARLLFPRSSRSSSQLSRIRSTSQFSGYKLINYRPWKLTRRSVVVHVIDESFTDFHPLNEDDNDIFTDLHLPYCHWGQGQESDDDDDDMHVYPYMDLDFPSDKKDHLQLPDTSFPLAAHTLAGYGPRRRRIQEGMILNLYLVAFIGIFLLFFDSFSWRIVRLPLEPYFLTKPFIISAAVSALAGVFYVPLLDFFKIYHIIEKEGPNMKIFRRVMPTMGGLFFVPIGIIVGRTIIGDSFVHFNMAVFATISFGFIGLFNDVLRGMRPNYGLFRWLKLTLQISIGILFSYWFDSARISTPYTMKNLVPLPRPIGLLNLGNFYFVIMTFCFATMGNGVSMTDGIDGLAGGISALSFFGMSIAVLALSPELAVFGASMAGSCIGFLFHNRYKASVIMGEIGLLAIGGALASMASFTGMFLPLFIATIPFSIELLCAFMQIVMRKNYGFRKGFFQKAVIFRKFKLFGIREPVIVGIVYGISYFLALLAGYIGLISA